MRPLWNTKDRYIHNIFIPANFLQIRNDDGTRQGSSSAPLGVGPCALSEAIVWLQDRLASAET